MDDSIIGSLIGEPSGTEDPERLEKERAEHYREYLRVLGFLALWVFAVMVVVHGINVPDHDPIYLHEDFRGDYGYTWSLALLYLPLGFLTYWYVRNRDKMQLRAVMRSVLWIVAGMALIWVTLDVFLANLLFRFPYKPAHVQATLIPGYTWADSCSTIWTILNPACYSRSIPLEEVFFYLGGAVVIQMLYMWAAEDFYSVYTLSRPAYERQAKNSPPLVHWSWRLIVAGLAVLAVGVILKKYGPHEHHDGWPWYLLAELLIVFLPLSAIYQRVAKFTNPPAFLFVLFLQIMISLIWEATFGLPLGWWNYQLTSMVGIIVGPWANLPLEACFLWLSVGWATVFAYEATKIKTLSGRTWPQTLFGRNSWLP